MVGQTQSGEQLSGRRVRTAGLAMAVTVTLFILLFMSGIGGLRGGWVWAPAVAVAAMAAVGWWGWGQNRRRLAAIVDGALSELVLGLWDSREALLSQGGLRAVMDSIAVPSNFEHTGDIPGGSGRCFDEGLVRTRRWLVAGDEETVRAQLVELFEGEGFVLGEWGGDRPALGTASAEGHRGRLRVLVGMGTDRAWKDGRPLILAPGQVEVTAILETD